jgi:error-prone DNA polymerase
MLPGYAELHCLSSFSFLRGASEPEELVERAHQAGYSALAITDECSFAGAVRAHVAAQKYKLKLIFGTELKIGSGPRLVLLAENRNGYGNLSALVTRARRAAAKSAYRLKKAALEQGVEDCMALLIPDAQAVEPCLEEWAAWLPQHFPGSCWLAVELLRGRDDAARLADLLALSRASGLPAVAAGDVHMHVRARRRLQDALTATRLKTTIDAAGHALFPNGERHLRSRAILARLYPPELLAETLSIAARCTFSLDELRYEYPEELVPAGETAAGYLRRLTETGYRERLAQIARLGLRPEEKAPQLRQQIEHELALIAELGYEPYFLTVYDIVAYARSQGILCQGRGSAANSAVCYCLGITEVDPWRATMLFERFISRERNEPPDIDVDFEHERREEVIQYLYRKYGRERAALAATVITYRPKSALKDMGRALGFDLDRLNHLTRNLAWWDRREQLPERLREAGFDPEQSRVRKLLELANTLIGFPRHLSQHVGGFVISRGPLDRLVPIENAAMADRTVIQWDKDDLDALGLLKVDVLALGMLSAIRRGLDLVSAWENRSFGLADIPPEDPAVYDMIGRADTVGVFQIESRAQMSMLPRLRPRRYYDLVIEVAIVRPGPIQGGMVHPYLRNRQKPPEDIEYPSEALRGVLERTLGVPIFQEQVMQLAMVAADFTPGEADQLRRSMAAWRRKGGLQRFEAKLIEGMRRNGYDETFAQRIYQQICGFGEYGFPESHAASFALLVYASAWLKCHFPAAFLCALLNSQPMGFYLPAQLIQDAQRHGVEVRPVAATVSDWDCTLEPATAPRQNKRAGPAVRLGLRLVSGLAEDSARRLVAARGVRMLVSVDDLAERAQLDRRNLDQLAAAGALASLAGHRRHAHWQAAGALPPPEVLAGAPLAEIRPTLAPPDEGEDIAADYQHLGFTLGRHPLALLRSQLQRLRFLTAHELNSSANHRLVRTAGLVTCRQRPGTASGVVFVTLEDETGVANIIVHAELVARQRRELLAARLMGVYGQLQREGEVVHVIAKRLVDHTELLGGLDTRSRDFH